MFSHTDALLFSAAVYSLEEKWRTRFESIFDQDQLVSLHRAWRQLDSELLAEFSCKFYFNAHHIVMYPLTGMAQYASCLGLIRMDGDQYAYHLDRDVQRRLQESLSVYQYAACMMIGNHLSYYLDEQENKCIIRSFTTLETSSN